MGAVREMDLYKLIVVDDEFVIRDGLMSFKWERFGFRAVGCASDGEEALERMREEKADLIITDIKMPLMDGIALIDKVRELYPLTKLIILTGYKDFEYARKAISAGVVEYLLKPVDLTDLEKVALKMKSRLDEDYQKAEQFENVRRQLKESMPLAVESFLRSLLEGKMTNLLEIEEKMDLLEIYLERPYYACAVFEVAAERADGTRESVPAWRREAEDCLKDYMNQGNLGCYYFDSDFRIVFLFNFTLPGDLAGSFEYLAAKVAELERLLKELAERPDRAAGTPGPVIGSPEPSRAANPDHAPGRVTVSAGCGCIYNSISYLHISYGQALSALQRRFFEEEGGVFYAWKEKASCLQIADEYPYEIENRLINAILDGSPEQVIPGLEEYWSSMDSLSGHLQPEQCKSRITQLLNMLERSLNRHGATLQEIAGLLPPFAEFAEDARNLAELKRKVEKLFVKACETISVINRAVKSSSHAAVQQALRYIGEHYNEKITLNELAEKVFLNPSYLSVQFKKEAGRNFVDYIKDVRIEKAKELLKGSGLKVYEISEAVGYHDCRYFTETFRDLTGLTPLEYKQKLIAP